MTTKIQAALLSLALLGLAACTTSEPKNDTFAPEAVESPEAAPTEPVETTALPKIWDAPAIMQTLSGRRFAYTRGSRRGTVEYAGDGTFQYDETGKGQGTGIWQASNGKLCEAFDPTSFLPKGSKSECKAFAAEGGGYTAGTTRLTPI
jgi:hypothetical protein